MINKAHAKRGGGIIIFIKIVFFSLMKRDVNKIYNTNTSTGMHGQTSIECSILRRELASRITKGTTSSLPFTNKSNSPKKKCSLTLSFLFLFSFFSFTTEAIANFLALFPFFYSRANLNKTTKKKAPLSSPPRTTPLYKKKKPPTFPSLFVKKKRKP